MEKFTQAPVGLDIDQTVSSNSQAIAKLDKAYDLGNHSSLSSLETAITTFANTLALNETRPIKFYAVSNIGLFKSYNFYAGHLTMLNATTHLYEVVVTSQDGYHIVISYNGSAFKYNELATNSIETMTPTIDSTYIASGTVKCVVKGGWAFVSGENVVFKMAGNSQQGVVTGLPKAALQVNGKFGGTNATTTAQIDAAGDSLWINQNAFSMNVHIGATYNIGHWFSIAYPVG